MPDDEPREVVASAEWPTYLAKCLEEQGYQVEVREGAVGFDPGSEVDSARVFYACHQRYPFRRDVIQLDLTETELRVQYDWLVHETVPCIADLGLPTAPVPSYEAFAAAYHGDQPLWFPGDYPDRELQRVQDHCPLLPPWETLFAEPKPGVFGGG